MDKGSIMLEEGTVVFLGAGEEFMWKARGRDDLGVYRAFCE
jgi:hypothetical protein